MLIYELGLIFFAGNETQEKRFFESSFIILKGIVENFYTDCYETIQNVFER